LDIWGQWIRGDQVLEKFKLTYSGKPSLFEGKAVPPADFNEVRLQVVAADQVGNIGQHTIKIEK
jgi:hypothetical protein